MRASSASTASARSLPLRQVRRRPERSTRSGSATTSLGDFGELVAALLPCTWGYSGLGRRLAAEGRPERELYARWIEMYASEEFAELAGWCRDVCGEAAAAAGEGMLARMREALLESSRYELAFWEPAWRCEQAS